MTQGWGRPFEDPIRGPSGELVTLRDAAIYMMGLPPKERRTPEWQTAAEALLLAVECEGPTMFARIGVMRALNRHYIPPLNPKGKEPHWGRRKLNRDADGRPIKITFGEMGVRGVLVYCHCGHHVALDADRWPDDFRS